MKKRFKQLPKQEMNRLMRIREVFHECGKDQSVCVVLPDGGTEERIFGSYYPALRQRMCGVKVSVTPLSGLSDTHLESDYIIDLSDMPL